MMSASVRAELLQQFVTLHRRLLSRGVKEGDLRLKRARCSNQNTLRLRSLICPVILLSSLCWNLTGTWQYLDGAVKTAMGIKCVVPNNYVVWEATRPVADCGFCRGVNSALVLPNVTREQFSSLAYSYRPMIVKGGAASWPAVGAFDFEFFRELFANTPGAYDSVREECQFLNFKTDLYSLEQVFSMNPLRVNNTPGQTPWYIGWSNCHQGILEIMRKYYSKPHFLPKDAEHSHVDYIFMGYSQGAFMHLDYISRLMWQAQLRGSKRWRLSPPPECDAVCQPFSFVVEPSDILLLDTRQWYHDTQVLNNELSVTVSSEYG